MAIIYVQFSDSAESEVVSIFGGPQDPELYPNQGEVEDSDERYLTFLATTVPSKESLAIASRDNLLSIAAIRIAPLQDAIDLEEGTPEEAILLKKWKQYRVALNRIQLQSGFPELIQWPVEPS